MKTCAVWNMMYFVKTAATTGQHSPLEFSKWFAVRVLLSTLLIGYSAYAQEVYVFPNAEPQSGDTIVKPTSNTDNAKLLVIPVITADSPFDPNNNLVNSYNSNPNLREDIVAKVNGANDFWLDASYGEVGVEGVVLDRFYQMPLGIDDYVNATFQDAQITGTTLSGPVTVPTGALQITLHITDSDESTYTINFVEADGPHSLAELVTLISDGISTSTSFDKLSVTTSASRLRFRVGEPACA